MVGMLNIPFSAIGLESKIEFENGHVLNPSELLFEKVEDDVIEKQVQKLADKKYTAEETIRITLAAQV